MEEFLASHRDSSHFGAYQRLRAQQDNAGIQVQALPYETVISNRNRQFV